VNKQNVGSNSDKTVEIISKRDGSGDVCMEWGPLCSGMSFCAKEALEVGTGFIDAAAAGAVNGTMLEFLILGHFRFRAQLIGDKMACIVTIPDPDAPESGREIRIYGHSLPCDAN
jgi:hypothetical protein